MPANALRVGEIILPEWCLIFGTDWCLQTRRIGVKGHLSM
jgi:hypothetical protein